MSRLNTDLLLAVREQITSHPETHDQGNWAQQADCGTTYCIAGWACVLSGKEIDWSEGHHWKGGLLAGHLTDGSRVVTAAGDLLGLEPYEQSSLFYAGNDGALNLLDALIEKAKNGED